MSRVRSPSVAPFSVKKGNQVLGVWCELEKYPHEPEPGLAYGLAESVLDSLTGKSGPVPVGQISEQTRNGTVVGYSLCPNVDRFTVGILALVAQRERELISERTKSALAAARRRGVKLGTKHPHRQVKLMVEGYRRQREEFLKKIRPVIDEIKSTGARSLTEIALCLTRRGIPTRTGKSQWFPSTVKTVIG